MFTNTYHCGIAHRQRMCVYNVKIALQNKTYMAPGRPVVWKCIRVQTRFPFHLLKSARFLTPKHMNETQASSQITHASLICIFHSFPSGWARTINAADYNAIRVLEPYNGSVKYFATSQKTISDSYASGCSRYRESFKRLKITHWEFVMNISIHSQVYWKIANELSWKISWKQIDYIRSIGCRLCGHRAS